MRRILDGEVGDADESLFSSSYFAWDERLL